MHSPLKSNREKWLILKHAFAFVTSYCIFFWLLDIVDMQWFHATFCIMCILFHSLFMTLCVLTELTFQLIMDHYKKQLIIVSRYLIYFVLETFDSHFYPNFTELFSNSTKFFLIPQLSKIELHIVNTTQIKTTVLFILNEKFFVHFYFPGNKWQIHRRTSNGRIPPDMGID